GGGATGAAAAGAGLGGGSESNGGSGRNGASGSGRGSESSAPAGAAGPGRPSSGAGGRADAGSSGSSGSAAGGPSGTRAGAGSAAGGTGSGGTGRPAAPSPGPGAGPAPGPTGAEIRLGSVGVQSGVLGATMAPFFLGARAWVADVTARGGLAGHPVRLIMGDDGGDPAKAQTLVHRMVEQDKVQAFYTVPAPTTLQAITPYLEQQQIPIIGLCECNPAVDESPMAFQPGIGSTTGLAWAHLAPLVGMTDKRKLSIFYCREVASCPQSAEGIKRLAGPVGVQVVHEVQMSLAQPDYTAEVLSARNAGADAIIVVADNATIVRILRSAHRQGYHPQVSTPTAGYEPRFIHSGGDDVEGTVVASSTVPWSTSPRMAGYRAAMERFVPGGELSTLGAEMWGSGKLIEVLARRFPANPTSADFLDALYALRGETVGGIFPPLAFVKGQGHVATNQCVVPVKVVGGQFKPLSDDQFSCAPGWRPVTP
ncbi:MAG: branched-chain amino acid transport system substrate-binding protein, partial [Actinomycetota bacterium]|nr:branched-chain amino acid transport system substrate-binding protein [Actinomycetota bacterium]